MKITLDDIKTMVNECVQTILTENVYMDKNKVNRNKKKIGLTYRKNSRNRDALDTGGADYLNTDKMDQSGADTYIVRLKNGIDSYNITNIKGVSVMHFFKKFWDNEKAIVKIKEKKANNPNDTVEDYELTMLENERLSFLNQFIEKIEIVLEDFINKNIENKESLRAISIYPVRSSSNFNNKMAQEMVTMDVLGLPLQIIRDDLFVKDLRNFERDEDFIKRNQEFYDGDFSAIKKFDKGTVSQNVDTALNRYKSLREVEQLLPEINECAEALLSLYYRNNTKGLSEKVILKLVELYKKYYDTLQKCFGIKYIDVPTGKEMGMHKEKILVSIKYTKGPSVETRSANIWNLVKPYLRGKKSPVTSGPYKKIDVCEWEKKMFEIKYLANSVRLGVRNIYNPNTDEKVVSNELERINNTLFVIFDDNISGGATLGDICYQCEKLGIKNVIPITFGQMEESNTMGIIPLSVPENGYNYE